MNSTLQREKIKKRSEPAVSYRIVKRIMDVILCLVASVILLPFILVIALIIKLDSNGPVFFIHNRIGYRGRPLPLLKFRTMKTDAEAEIANFTPEQKTEWEANFKLDNDPRITRFGRFLRKTSIDELPQLLNIIRGELSIVGPRPVIAVELEKYGENKDKFLSVKPGLTGYWQAYARSNCSYEQRMEMELYYVENASLKWDIKIILATVLAVLRKTGAK